MARILDNELRRALSFPTLEEGETTRSVAELGIDLQTIIEPIEEMVNEQEQPLTDMWRLRVNAFWFAEGEQQTASVETWRYGRLYQL